MHRQVVRPHHSWHSLIRWRILHDIANVIEHCMQRNRMLSRCNSKRCLAAAAADRLPREGWLHEKRPRAHRALSGVALANHALIGEGQHVGALNDFCVCRSRIDTRNIHRHVEGLTASAAADRLSEEGRAHSEKPFAMGAGKDFHDEHRSVAVSQPGETIDRKRYLTAHPFWGNRRPTLPAASWRALPMDDDFISDDPGTILDSYASVPLALPPAPSFPSPPAPAPSPPIPAFDEIPYRSPYRWTAPRVVICDDGSLEQGETVYVRSDKVIIGRTKGDIVIGHDVAMSGSHAEITRREYRGKHEWVLRDLGSSNGTLVRVRTVTLKPGVTIMLGSKRYRFDPSQPEVSQPGADGEPGTALVTDLAGPTGDAFPALVENVLPTAGMATRYPLRTSLITIGRSGCGNGIELDDPCIAKYHAVITRDPAGIWQLESQPSLNGVWVKVDSVRLTENCSFQCGEQRFRFLL